MSNNLNSDEDSDSISISKLCSKFVSIICEYYQVLKNKNIPNSEEKILYLLEKVFGQAKNELSK